MSFVVRPFLERDTEAADLVLRAAFKTSYGRRNDIMRYLRVQPSCAFVAKGDDGIIGFGGAVDFGRFSYVGLMAVDPKVHRRGAGGMIFEEILGWLEARNCPTVLLDASAYGGPLYEKYGFVESDLTLVLQRSGTIEPAKVRQAPPSALLEGEFPKLVSFDVPRFGADRSELLRTYFEDNPARFLVSRDGQGLIDGFLVAQSRVIGPWIASNSSVAEKLLVGGLTFSFDDNPTVFVSESNKEAVELLSQHGFGRVRTQRHMYKGKPIQRDRRNSIYGQAALAFG